VESPLGTLDTPPPKRLLDEVLPNAIAATATDAEDDMLKTPLTGEEVGAIGQICRLREYRPNIGLTPLNESSFIACQLSIT
jgi:hypothetical protein